jgi:hypothetical protein
MSDLITVTRDNYFSPEVEMQYMGSTQFKRFMSCEAMALAMVKGEHIEEKSTSLLVGSYVDAYFEGTLDKFMSENPEIFTKSGDLKAEYKHAEVIIRRLERDEMYMRFMSGQKQVIKTGEIEGIPFKIRIDSYHPGKAIVDQKIMKDFDDVWKDGLYVSFVEAWGYDYQAAIYQTIEGNRLPFFIAGGTKEKVPNLEIFSIPQRQIDFCLLEIKKLVHRFADIKKGLIEPTRCGTCDYCKSTKVLKEIVPYKKFDEAEEVK